MKELVKRGEILEEVERVVGELGQVSLREAAGRDGIVETKAPTPAPFARTGVRPGQVSNLVERGAYQDQGDCFSKTRNDITSQRHGSTEKLKNSVSPWLIDGRKLT
jgi:hypothetical protein